ncbi:DNA polymerase III subunit delta' [Moorella thermoacetica]|uniref:DNA polymerase III subunit delta' n=1 Tax=Neomoorella thermoacetica TaxID=1525 RepID=UPI00069D64D7|nr:DNA polymerase III subunit delta' [Moorella thermoacetica]AKX92872.1 DNA polymerase III subunit delta' [Moorella thermoacetica]
MTAHQQLKQALLAGKLAHAYLLVGGSEEGRRAEAIYLATALNCRYLQGGEPCGSCHSCRQMAGGNHPDFYLLEPRGTNLKIAQIRELEARLALQAFQGGVKVAVLAGADTMTEAAANCLLKTLEEPPEGTYLILLAAQPDPLLPTIRSRCQEIHLEGAMAISQAGTGYWARLVAADLPVIMEEILPELEKEADLPAVLTGMALACRDQLVWQLTGSATLLLKPGEPLTPFLAPSRLWACFWTIQDTLAALEHNANHRLALEVMMFKLYTQFSGEAIHGGEPSPA